jgi:small-conductance mechanosensitive channel
MSRGRLTNQLYHGPATDHDEPLHHHVHHDEDVPDLTSQLRRSRAEQPITPEVAQIASTWRATLRYLASTAVQQQPHVHAEHRRTSQERAAVVQRIEDLERQQARTVGPAIRRHTRAQRAALAAELEGQRDRLARLDHTLDQLDDRLAHLPTSQQITAARTRLRDLDTQLRHHSRIHAAHLAADPPPYLLAVVGPPPSDRQQQTQWYRAVEEIEHHRLRWGITDPARALGSGSRDEVHELEHRRLQRILKGDGATPDRQIVQRSRGRAR